MSLTPVRIWRLSSGLWKWPESGTSSLRFTSWSSCSFGVLPEALGAGVWGAGGGGRKQESWGQFLSAE